MIASPTTARSLAAVKTKLHSGVGFCLPLSGAVAAETKLHSGVGVCLLNEMGCRS